MWINVLAYTHYIGSLKIKNIYNLFTIKFTLLKCTHFFRVFTELCKHHSSLISECSLWCSLVTQSCLTLGDPMDCSLRGYPVHGIFQARVPEWVAIAFSHVPIMACNYVYLLLFFLVGYWLWKLINIFYYCYYVTIAHLISLYHDWSTEK